MTRCIDGRAWLAAVALIAVCGCEAREPRVTSVVAAPPAKASSESSSSESPDDEPAAPPPRPDWVDAPPRLNGGVYETNVIVGPETSREAAEAKLASAVESAAQNYAARTFGSHGAELDLSYQALRSRVVGPTWEERLSTDDHDAVFLHTRLKFDDQLRATWQRAVDQWTTATRTFAVVRGLTFGLLGLFVLHVALRFGGRRGAAS